MIRNEAKLIGRLTADPELKYTKNSNTPVCNVVLAVNNIYNDDASENIPDLDPNHKSQEEYQMIHNALSESEDLPF